MLSFRRILHSLLLFALLAGLSGSAAAAGSDPVIMLDPSIGTNGYQYFNFFPLLPNTMLPEPGTGKLLIVLDGCRSYENSSVRRFLPDGTPDPTFGANGSFNPEFERPVCLRSAAYQPDGKIVVVGELMSRLNEYTIFSDFLVLRLNPDGSLDTSFNASGAWILDRNKLDELYGVVVQPDGKIVVVGKSLELVTEGWGSYNLFHAAVFRLNSDGALDISFADQGLFLHRPPGYDAELRFVAMGPGPEYDIVALGTSSGNNLYLLRLTSEGQLATTFDGDGFLLVNGYDEMIDLIVQPDGKILVSSNLFIGVSPSYPHTDIFRFNPDGSPDLTFGAGDGKLDGKLVLYASRDDANPRGVENRASSMQLAGDGKIMLGGWGAVQGTRKNWVVRLDPNGNLDPSYSGSGIYFLNPPSLYSVFDIVLDSDRSAYVLGYAGTVFLARVVENHAPELAETGPVLVTMDEDASGQRFELTLHATDPDGDPLAWSIPYGKEPVNGYASISDGVVSYHPRWDYNNDLSRCDSFEVHVEDIYGLSQDIEVCVIVNPVNDLPVIYWHGGPSEVNEFEQIEFTVETEDVDETDAVILSLETDVSTAAFDPASGVFRWEPQEEDGPGVYTFTFKATDSRLGQDEHAYTVKVNEANQAPYFEGTGHGFSVKVGESLTFTVQAKDDDLPKNEMAVTAPGLPEGAAYSPETGVFAWTPAEDRVGDYEFEIQVNDGAETASYPVKITVKEPDETYAVFVPFVMGK